MGRRRASDVDGCSRRTAPGERSAGCCAIAAGRDRPLATFATVTVPASRDAILAGVALAWARALGEFGATFLVVRVGSWDSLSIMVDQVASRPKFDPYVFPTAMALATILMVVTLLVLAINERARAWRNRHDL